MCRIFSVELKQRTAATRHDSAANCHGHGKRHPLFLTGPDRPHKRKAAAAAAFFDEYHDCSPLAGLELSGFTIYTLLRGYENAVRDMVLEPVRFAALMDLIH